MTDPFLGTRSSEIGNPSAKFRPISDGHISSENLSKIMPSEIDCCKSVGYNTNDFPTVLGRGICDRLPTKLFSTYFRRVYFLRIFDGIYFLWISDGFISHRFLTEIISYEFPTRLISDENRKFDFLKKKSNFYQ